MARKQKLKVYRTPIGFHDAYVAAPSQKAALAAWGSDADLFARGVAELVSDPELTAAPLARPGEVIRLSRGSAAEQIAALPPGKAKKPAKAKRGSSRAAATPAPSPVEKPPRRKRIPPPDRAALDEAESAIAAAERRQARQRDALAGELESLQQKRRRMEAEQGREIERLRRARDKAEARYERAVRDWEG